MVGGFTITKWINGGGNADVYKAVKNSSQVALKVLRNRKGDSEPYRRFAQEAKLHKLLSDGSRRGILPLLAFDVPDDPTDERPPWLAMPIAEPIEQALGNEPQLEEVVSAVAGIAGVLAELHAEDIAHRDIKPGNLYRYQGVWAVGDFGLVGVPDGEPLTIGAKALGPRNFIAPEMTLRPDGADGRRADVYSLGKTLWCLSTGLPTPPAGEHRRELTWKRLAEWGVAHPRAFYLDRLIEQMCTEIPEDRPQMVHVAETLAAWAQGPTDSDPGRTPLVTDLANEIADVLTDDRQHQERAQARRAEVETLADQFAEMVSGFSEQLDDARLPYRWRGPREENGQTGVSGALQGFADGISSPGLVAAWRVVEVQRNAPPSPHGFLNSGAVAALATDQTVVFGAAHTIMHAGGNETVWKGTSEVVLFGSAAQEREMRRLAGGFLEAVPDVLRRYLQIIRGDT